MTYLFSLYLALIFTNNVLGMDGNKRRKLTDDARPTSEIDTKSMFYGGEGTDMAWKAASKEYEAQGKKF